MRSKAGRVYGTLSGRLFRRAALAKKQADGWGSERCSDLPQGTAERCSAARPVFVFFFGSSLLPSASIGCLGALLGRQTSTVALKEKRKRGDNQEVRKGMKTGDAELSDASVTGQRGKDCRVTGSHT